MHRMYCLNTIAEKGFSLLPDTYELVQSINDAEALLIQDALLDTTPLPNGLLAIGCAGAKIAPALLDECTKRGIAVFDTPRANANAVKELALCAMLLSSRNILEGAAWCREHAQSLTLTQDANAVKDCFMGHEIAGRNVGVIGLGAVGGQLVRSAVALGMNVYGYDPYVARTSADAQAGIHRVTDLEELCAVCDYLVVRVPASTATQSLIGEAEIAAMKPGATLINLSACEVIDTAALADALEAQHIKCYFTDFPTQEALALPHTIVLPHLGDSTVEAQESCACAAVREVVSYIDEGSIENSLNFPAVQAPVLPEGAGRIALLHTNRPNMVGQITAALAEAGANISHLMNASRNEAAYTLIDTDESVGKVPLDQLRAIEGVWRLRTIR